MHGCVDEAIPLAEEAHEVALAYLGKRHDFT